MNDHEMAGEQLGDLLVRASEHVHAPDLTARAWAAAERRRRERRVGLAGIAAALVVVGGVVALQVGGDDAKVGPAQTPSQTPRPTTDTEEPADLATPPAVDPEVIQPVWDPATVDSLPPGDLGLPADMTPPPSAPALTGISAARAAVLRDGLLFVLAEDGGWRMTKLIEDQDPGVDYDLALSGDGLVVSVAGHSGLLSIDVRGSTWRRAPYPPGFRVGPGNEVNLQAQAAGEMAWLEGSGRRWQLDVQTGKADVIHVPDHVYDVALAWGLVVGVGSAESPYGARTLEVGRTVFDADYFHSLTGLAADGDSLAAVRGVTSWTKPKGDFEQNGLIALELDDMSTRAYLPIRDPDWQYSDAGLMEAVAWLDPDTVLVSVVDGANHASGERTLLTWQVESGDLRRVASLPAALPYDVATGLPGPP